MLSSPSSSLCPNGHGLYGVCFFRVEGVGMYERIERVLAPLGDWRTSFRGLCWRARALTCACGECMALMK